MSTMNPYYNTSWLKPYQNGYNQPQQLNNAPSWGSNQIAGYGDSSTYLDERDPEMFPSSSNGMNFGQMAQGAAAGFSAGMANSQPIGDFTVDELAGFKGSGQGFMSGGTAGAIIGGVTAQYGQFKKVNDNLNDLNTSVDGVTYDAYGRPVYNASAFTNANANLGELNRGIRKLSRTQADPATNLISTFTGTRRKMKRKRNELMQGMQRAQQGYNQADVDFRNQTMAQNEYYDRLNNNNRLYNLYR